MACFFGAAEEVDPEVLVEEPQELVVAGDVPHRAPESPGDDPRDVLQVAAALLGGLARIVR
jgi:hypothetical protein